MIDPRRSVPPLDQVLDDPHLTAARARLGRGFVKARVVEELARVREQAATGVDPAPAIAARVAAGLPEAPTSLRRVINATGIIVHTNLGRAPLSPAAKEALVQAGGSTDVELDLGTGRRAPRGAGAIRALEELSGAGAHVVNNGAAALTLACFAMAPGGNIILSRGEMVEIGDGFRIPELLAATGVQIREVGTTNRTHLEDYLDAIDDRTGFVLKVHPSNFSVTGFTAGVGVRDLAGHTGVPVVADIGSGLLAPHPRLPDEPDARTVLREGADLVIASGDKLLGGPQAGLLLGDRDLIARLRRHPLARALRVDKLTFAALEATLLGPPAPIVRALSTTHEDLTARAGAIAKQLPGPVTVRSSTGAVGGGGAPGQEVASAALVLPEDRAIPLRLGSPSVVGHVSGGDLLIDLLAVDPSEDENLTQALRAVLEHTP